MSEQKHTPGPWLVDPIKIGTPWNIGATDGTEIALAQATYGDPLNGQPERTANAHLIAAAPELKQALINLKAEVRGLMFVRDALREIIGNTNLAVLDERVAEAEAAIAKAEGRS